MKNFDFLAKQGKLKREFWELDGVENESFVWRDRPGLLILSGKHGDEYGVIGCVKEVIAENIERCPSFLFIPEVSPSAVRQRTRTNEEGKDINRMFCNSTKSAEVGLIFKILEDRQFSTCLSFHEDSESPQFYLYDIFGPNLEGTDILKKLRKEVKSLGLGLLNGVDDSDDPMLGNFFKDGYKYFPPQKPYTNIDGTFSSWAFSKGIVERYLNPEIPGKIPLGLKKKAVEAVFDNLIFRQSF